MPEPTQTSKLVATFYKFFDLGAPNALQSSLRKRGKRAGLTGTILLAEEGINGTLSGAEKPLLLFLEELREMTGIELSQCKFSRVATAPFRRFRVLVKQELVTFRQPCANPRQQTGDSVPPNAWNALIEQDDVRLIDTRNEYETAIGTFDGAEDPHTENFTDFAQYVEQQLDPQRDRKIAMYCTGGIRCEKASSYLLAQGFEQVFHLDGGILRYLEEVEPTESRWQGECYVFDERVSVNHDLQPGEFRNCSGCGWPAKHGEACPQCQAKD